MNKLPEVKRFVKSGCGTSKTSKACDIYPELYIKFKGGAKPHIFYPDPDGGEEKKVAIQDWKTDEIHNWFESRDFKRVEPPPKTDEQIAAEKAEEEYVFLFISHAFFLLLFVFDLCCHCF